jgi:hypothetical protein
MTVTNTLAYKVITKVKSFTAQAPKDLPALNQAIFCLKSLAGGKFKLLNFPVLFEKER